MTGKEHGLEGGRSAAASGPISCYSARLESQQLRPYPHWCLTSPFSSVVPDLVLNTVMTLTASKERCAIAFGRLPCARSGLTPRIKCWKEMQ